MTDAEPKPWDALLRFWLEEVGPKGWWVADDAVDAACAARFGALSAQAVDGGLADWAEDGRGSLALLILLDQIPRNIHRGAAAAFAGDARARAVAEAAVARGDDHSTPTPERLFFYLPFEHSEDLADQDRAVALFESRAPELANERAHAEKHRDVIRRFGRFPHRNEALGRESTPEEIAYLDGGGYAPGARPARPKR